MILANKHIRLLVQGITGKEGSLHTRLCREYGTKIVAGVTPGKGGTNFEGIPVFNTAAEAVEKERANASVIFVPPPFAADAIMEAAQADLRLVVCITEGIPVSDMMKVKSYLKNKKTKLIGPNCPGIISPQDRVKIGIMPVRIHKLGSIGVVSRSGSLTYEVVSRLSRAGFGQSTCLGIGGDPIVGLDFADCLELFEEDDQTEAVIMVGEIGGNYEEKAAKLIQYMTKPVVAYICGKSAPPEKKMGHAGAIVSGNQGRAADKIAVLKEAGVAVADTLDEIVIELKKSL